MTYHWFTQAQNEIWRIKELLEIIYYKLVLFEKVESNWTNEYLVKQNLK